MRRRFRLREAHFAVRAHRVDVEVGGARRLRVGGESARATRTTRPKCELPVACCVRKCHFPNSNLTELSRGAFANVVFCVTLFQSQTGRTWFADGLVQRGTFLLREQSAHQGELPSGVDLAVSDGDRLLVVDLENAEVRVHSLSAPLFCVETDSNSGVVKLAKLWNRRVRLGGFGFVKSVGCVFHDRKNRQLLISDPHTLAIQQQISFSFKCDRSRIVQCAPSRFLVALLFKCEEKENDIFEFGDGAAANGTERECVCAQDQTEARRASSFLRLQRGVPVGGRDVRR